MIIWRKSRILARPDELPVCDNDQLISEGSLVVSNSCEIKHLKVTEKSISIKGLNVKRIIQVQIIQAAV